MWNWSQVTEHIWYQVNIGSGYGLVLPGNKPLSEPALLQICCHVASIGHKVLTHLPYCRIYASENRISIGSDNGLSPIRHQAII